MARRRLCNRVISTGAGNGTGTGEDSEDVARRRKRQWRWWGWLPHRWSEGLLRQWAGLAPTAGGRDSRFPTGGTVPAKLTVPHWPAGHQAARLLGLVVLR